MTNPAPGWEVRRSSGSAGAFHDLDLEGPARRALWVHEVDAPTLVLGSTQPAAVVDPEAASAASVTVVRRRSGGGAVLVEPGGVVWVDVILPAGDPLWDDDVARATHWVGEAWAGALADCDQPAEVHRRGPAETAWSRLVCFGGLGPGEVTLAGRKVVGIAQRRTRAGARFQCAALLRWAPGDLLALLALSPGERAAAGRDLAQVAGPTDAGAADLLVAFIAHIGVA